MLVPYHVVRNAWLAGSMSHKTELYVHENVPWPSGGGLPSSHARTVAQNFEGPLMRVVPLVGFTTDGTVPTASLNARSARSKHTKKNNSVLQLLSLLWFY